MAAYVSGKAATNLITKALDLGKARKAMEAYALIAQDGEKAAETSNRIKSMLTGDKLIDGEKIIEEGLKASKKLKWADPVLRLSGSTIGALGESRIEAITNSNHHFDGEKDNLDMMLPEQY